MAFLLEKGVVHPEVDMVNEFVNIIQNIRLHTGDLDCWIWKVDNTGSYSVK